MRAKEEAGSRRRVAWITGASSGIGRSLAVELAGAGWRLGLGARRVEILRELLAGLPDAGVHAAAALDVTDSRSVARWAGELRSRLGRGPEVVVNCAGHAFFEPIATTSEEDFDRAIDTNLKGIFLVVRETLPAMLESGAGHFVNVLSVAARVPFPRNAAYNASKFGALGLTEAMRVELRRKGIRVTAVLPGATDTPLWDRLPGEWDRTRMMKPEEVARAIRAAIEAGPEALVEEIVIAPPLGNL